MKRMLFYTAAVSLVLLGFGATLVEFGQVNKISTDRDVGRYELLGYAELNTRLEAVNQVVYGAPGQKVRSTARHLSPKEHFWVAGQLRDIDGSIRRWSASKKGLSTLHGVDYDRPSFDMYTHWVRDLELTHSLNRATASEQSEFKLERERHIAAVVPIEPLPAGAYDRTLQLLGTSYGVGAAMSACHYMIRIQTMELSLALELSYPSFWVWTFLWPIGLFCYPKNVSVRAQLKRFMELVSFIGTVVLSFGTAGLAKAQQGSSGGGKRTQISGSATTFSMNGYLGTDGAVFFPGPVQQSSLTVNLPKGLFAGAWSSVALNHQPFTSGFGSETDLTVGWQGTLRGFQLRFSAGYNDVFPLLRGPTGDVAQVSVSASKGAGRFEPFVRHWRAWPTKGTTPGAGWFFHTGTSYTRPIRGPVSLNLTGEVIHDSGAFGFNRANLMSVVVQTPWKLRQNLSLAPHLRWVSPIGNPHDGRKRQIQFGLGLSYSF